MEEEKLQTIFDYGGKKLSVDKSGNLYWNGKRLVTKKEISLNFWERIFAALTALGIFLGGLGTLIPIYINNFQY